MSPIHPHKRPEVLLLGLEFSRIFVFILFFGGKRREDCVSWAAEFGGTI